MRVQFEKYSGFADEYSTNISLGGMFIKTPSPKPVGTIVGLEFRLADGSELIKGTGRVVWTHDGSQWPERPPGMGVRFRTLSPGSREIIFQLVEHCFQQGGTPFDLEQLSREVAGARGAGGEGPEGGGSDMPDQVSDQVPHQVPAAPAAASASAPGGPAPVDPWAAKPAAPVSGVAVPPPDLDGTLARRRRAAARRPGPRRAVLLAVLGVVLVLAAAGTVFQDRLLVLLGGTSHAVAATPAGPAHQPPPPVVVTPQAPPEPAAAASPGSTHPAAPAAGASQPPASAVAAGEPPGHLAPRATRIESITWSEVAGATELTIAADGPIRAAAYTRLRVEGPSPREVIKLRGIDRPYPEARLAVGTRQVKQVRTGYHRELDPSELHVVIDLTGGGVAIERIEEDGPRLHVFLKEP